MEVEGITQSDLLKESLKVILKIRPLLEFLEIQDGDRPAHCTV